MSKIKAWLAWLWADHIQKTMAALISGLTVADVLGAAGPIKSLFGDKTLQIAVLVASIIVFIKARTVKPPAPPIP